MRSEPQPAPAALSRVVKRRGATLAVDGVDLVLSPGRCVALLGPNGAGKSTTVGLLTGRLKPDSGEARIFGGDPRDRRSRLRLGVMLQEAGLPPTSTVAEQIDLFRGYYPQPRGREEIVRLAGLEGLERRRCSALSGGQQRRVQFGLAVAGRPDLLMLDEPTTGLDVEARHALWRAVRAEVARGAAVLLTTHHLEEAEALADRILVLDRGRIVADGAPHELKAGAAASAIRCRTRLSNEALETLPGVGRVYAEGGRTVLLTASPPATLRRLLALDEDLDDLTVSGASLEDAFRRLVETPEPQTLSEAS